MNAYDTFETPLGPFTVVVSPDGTLEAAAFGALDHQTKLLKCALSLTVRHLIASGEVRHDLLLAAEARRQVEEFFGGTRSQFDLPLAEPVTEFQRRYREEMAALGCGETITYGELARRLDSSPRAAGRVNATNPLCIIVPCHRVVGADGSLTGYAYGVDIKGHLLEHEAVLTRQPLLV
jgi:methylated-DNA-[protein]-cysteine S-methyltransferase